MALSDKIVEGAKLGGWFSISADRQVLGELVVDGLNTRLLLHDKNFFNLLHDEHRYIRGTLHDLTKVSLLGCTIRSSAGTASRNKERFHYCEVVPQHIVWGDQYLDPEVPSIWSIIFHVDDAETIFDDFDAFGISLDPELVIDAIVSANAKRVSRDVPTGPHPQVAYFTGRTEIFSIKTTIGTIAGHHMPIAQLFGSPRRVGIENSIGIEISFDEAQLFEDALDRVIMLRRFLELLAGRPQTIDWVHLYIGNAENPTLLNLYWCMPPKRSPVWEQRKPHPIEILVDPIQNKGAFEDVLYAWVASDPERMEARVRFSEQFSLQRRFTIDRLVAAANMFDILPASALPMRAQLEPSVEEARRKAREIFRKLPPSDERDSILNALGRVGRETLRQKIRYRAKIVEAALEETLCKLDIVTDEAVKCRNHFVHGSPGSFDYAEHGDVVTFLTQVLEFLFGASDLIDAGWNVREWRKQGSVGAHPFNSVLDMWERYAEVIHDLRKG